MKLRKDLLYNSDKSSNVKKNIIKATVSSVFLVGSFQIHFNTDVHNLLCRLALITIVGPIILKS